MNTATKAVPTTSRGPIPTFPVLIGVVYGVCVGLMTLSVTAEIILDEPSDGPRTFGEQIIGLLGFGTLALVVSLAGASLLSRTPKRARGGAIAFGVLCIPALAFFWCGMPGMFGATAAYLAGLTCGGKPTTGGARAAGVVGLVFAIVNPILHIVLISGSWIADLT